MTMYSMTDSRELFAHLIATMPATLRWEPLLDAHRFATRALSGKQPRYTILVRRDDHALIAVRFRAEYALVVTHTEDSGGRHVRVTRAEFRTRLWEAALTL
jgi:hypothetical protein